MPLPGFGNSKSSSSTTEATGGAQTQTGDPLSLNINANRSNIDAYITNTTNNVSTDHGALGVAESIALEAFEVVRDDQELTRLYLSEAGELTSEGLDLADRLFATALAEQGAARRDAFEFGDRAFDVVDETLAQGFDFARGAVGELGEQSEDAIASVGRAAALAVESAGSALEEVNRDGSERIAQQMLWVAGAVVVVGLLSVVRGR